MSFLTRVLSKPVAHRSWNLSNAFVYQTQAGVTVTPDGSLRSTAVFACVRVLSESIASLPLNVYERRADGGKTRSAHYLQSILHDLPNPEMTSFELRETLMGHLALWGNAYCEIERARSGRVKALWPLKPNAMNVERVGGQLIYKYQLSSGEVVPLSARNVMHVRGLSNDGIVGYSPITMARQAVGLALATEEFGSRFFGNGARPGMVLEHPGALSSEAQRRLRDSINATHRGLSNAHRVMILEEGMKLETIGIPPNDAQFLETRKFQIEEVARIFNVPLHKIGDLEHATFSNIEHQGIEFVVHTIRPWLVRFEQAMRRDLFGTSERDKYFAAFVVDGLLRGDTESRYNAYATARQNGWMSANDIRQLENMNPVAGGDVYLVPLNMIPAEQMMNPPAADAKRTERRGIETRDDKKIAVARQQMVAGYRAVFEDAVGRVLRREINDVRGQVTKRLRKKGEKAFRDWLETFYEAHKAVWESAVLPVLRSMMAQVGTSVAQELDAENEDIGTFLDDYAATMASRNVAESQLQLMALLDDDTIDDVPTAIETRLDGWQDTRTGKTAIDETFRAGNALAKAFYVAAGVEYIRWWNLDDACPYCKSLNGRIVGVNQVFLSARTDWQPKGANRPLNVRSNVGHAPAHSGCNCVTMASR